MRSSGQDSRPGRIPGPAGFPARQQHRRTGNLSPSRGRGGQPLVRGPLSVPRANTCNRPWLAPLGKVTEATVFPAARGMLVV